MCSEGSCPPGAVCVARVLDKLIDFAVHRRGITLAATLAFAVFGAVTFTKLKVEAFPDVTNVQVMVITLYPGQAPEEVEKQVTIPVERALTGRRACWCSGRSRRSGCRR